METTMTKSLEEKIQEGEKVNHSLIEQAKALAVGIVDRASFELAANQVKEIDRRLEWWAGFIQPSVDAAYHTYVEIRTRRDEIKKPLEEAKKQILGPAMARYQERASQEAKAEQERLQSEMRKAQEEALLREAEAAHDAGDLAKAKAILETPIVDVAIAIPKIGVEGVSFRETYSAEVTDLAELVKAVSRGEVSIQALKANETWLNGQARALKTEFKSPGVKLVRRAGISTRTEHA